MIHKVFFFKWDIYVNIYKDYQYILLKWRKQEMIVLFINTATYHGHTGKKQPSNQRGRARNSRYAVYLISIFENRF
jgi:hypothetical protein